MSKEKKLSDKHKLFCIEYVKNNCNAYKAYKAVYPESSDDAARSSSSDLLTKPNIRDEIDKKIDEILQNKKDLTLKVINEYKKIAFSDMKEYINPVTGESVVDEDTDTAVIKSIQYETIKSDKDKIREKYKFELYNKQSALDSISKLVLGLSEKHELTGEDGSDLFGAFLKNLGEE